jgi:hypothetical protein
MPLMLLKWEVSHSIWFHLNVSISISFESVKWFECSF